MSTMAIEQHPAAQAAAGSSFYAGMRVLPKAERMAMYDIYGFCRLVDDIADDQTLALQEQRTALQPWRTDVEALYPGNPPGPAAVIPDPAPRYGLEKPPSLPSTHPLDMHPARP